MIWEKFRLWLKKEHGDNLPIDTIGSVDSLHKSEKAKENAFIALREAEQRQKELAEIARQIAQIRYRNHFGESIQAAMSRRVK